MKTNRSILVASFWMVAISLVLFFVPALNGLIAGAVGGYMAGSVKRGLLAAFLPAVVVAALLWVILALLEAPIIGFFAGTAAGVVVLLADLGLFVGAVGGGAYAQHRFATPRHHP